MGKRESREGTCKIEGCDSPIKSKRLCEKHYARMRRHGSPFAIQTVDKEEFPLCIAFDCDKPSRTKGLCSYHYSNYKRNKTPYLPVVIKLCRVMDCSNEHHAIGLCDFHYKEWHKLIDELEIDL